MNSNVVIFDDVTTQDFRQSTDNGCVDPISKFCMTVTFVLL